jgi:hypothetical protein
MINTIGADVAKAKALIFPVSYSSGEHSWMRRSGPAAIDNIWRTVIIPRR